MSSFSFIDLPGLGRASRDREPNLCPHCGHRITPEELSWTTSSDLRNNPPDLECTFKCTNIECGHAFIAVYKLCKLPADSQRDQLLEDLGGHRVEFQLHGVVPTLISKTPIPAEVAELSPTFVEIFRQAEEAEAYELTQICGLGYRKAVEFLVKDFSATRNPAEKESINALSLAQCIARYVTDERVRDCATRAAWLGNDEAHYVRKWADKDIEDMKVLIRLTCIWLESMLLTERYRNEMT